MARGDAAMDTNKPVLIVDDYVSTLRVISRQLQRLGFIVVDEASDGSSALVLLRQKRYGLVNRGACIERGRQRAPHSCRAGAVTR